MAEDKTTPMMQQYLEVRRGLAPGTLLLFRLGDFYELFHEDAVEASRILGLTLTKRHEMPMAGLPFHAAESYIGRLLAAGRKVAICDQLEPPRPGKLVKRALTRILSPGTTLQESQLDPARGRYLAAVVADRAGVHAAWLDLSSGDFQLASESTAASLLPVLHAIDPAEVVVPEGSLPSWENTGGEPHPPWKELAAFCRARHLSERPAYQFEAEAGARTVAEALRVHNLAGYGLQDGHAALGPAAALVHYATESLRTSPGNLRTVRLYRAGGTLLLDPATLRNLEVLRSVRLSREGSLLAAMDATRTPPGARLLESWLAAPTLDLAAIRARQAAVGELAADAPLLTELRQELEGVRDLVRIVGRLQNRIRNPRELGGVRDTTSRLPRLCELLHRFHGPALAHLAARVRPLPELDALLSAALADSLPAGLEDGGVFRSGYDAELERLRSLSTGNKAWLAELERQECEKTGIKSLKVRYNANFGYFIEVTKANLHLVPAHYLRRQTTVGGERFTTDDLRLKEKEILHAEELSLARERELFFKLVEAVLAHAPALLETAAALAEIDVLAGWAAIARERDYCRPELDDGDRLEIAEGRHPVVEQVLRAARVSSGEGAAFVPNDAVLDASAEQILLLTGPNMAGKSTYIRQVALITLMAQVGSWVPAKSCRVGWVDRIFSRIGASDDLARGNSTFMVEMNETANILHHATPRSLVVLDEVGRGTSTYDGLSIAWAVVEHLHGSSDRGPRTLFATHYQELTQLDKALPRLRNASVAVKEWADEIVFVRRVVPGAADRSYGIQVARLAGLPSTVITRAKDILRHLEGEDPAVILPAASAPKSSPRRKISVSMGDGQLDLFGG